MAEQKLTLACAEAAGLAEEILIRSGAPQADASLVADCLLEAEISRMPSHGFLRLRPTVERIHLGLINPRPNIRCQMTAPNICLFDGDGAMGQVAGHQAMQECIRIAKEYGSAFAAVRRVFHFGMIGRYVRTAASQGCLAFVCTNASAQMAPFGGMTKVLGTNPFAIAFPTVDGDAFSLDVSTAAAARGKIRMAAREGRVIPAGWAIDPEGRDTTSPEAGLKGSVLPMAGHKGFGMAMAVDMLSGILTGADLSYEAPNMFDSRSPVNTGCFMMALDLSRFVPDQAVYEARMSAWLERIRFSELRPGVDSIHVPGDTQNALRRDHPNEITLSRSTWDDMQQLLRECCAKGDKT